ncbi:hypothetical protein CBW24_07790 [Pacificitalea manganoxidans]|uniref:Uncharacterized protein n=1 Tax=Pacificitalea manganoxidans TaxID=1411902 RepID=A0A291LYY7_9RHOB|nr:hypothetical protein [Pacificitalea manganoxidans]ATI41911.1 hypothetical protein CBW24_07790 [Pacificitalea manganoxidans]MDR6309396.1 hypothetical protein [Pacificitalea manganoxidans]
MLHCDLDGALSRRMALRAHIALIDQVLATGSPIPEDSRAVVHLANLGQAGLSVSAHQGYCGSMLMLQIRVTAPGTPADLLRMWRAHAAAELSSDDA